MTAEGRLAGRAAPPAAPGRSGPRPGARSGAASRAGFTLVELMVAVVLLFAMAIALVGTTRIVSRSLRQATLELRAAQLIHDEVHRLRTLPSASLQDGTATHPGGSSAWTVADSGAYLRVELEVTTAPLAGTSLVDTLYVYRTP